MASSDVFSSFPSASTLLDTAGAVAAGATTVLAGVTMLLAGETGAFAGIDFATFSKGASTLIGAGAGAGAGADIVG